MMRCPPRPRRQTGRRCRVGLGWAFFFFPGGACLLASRNPYRPGSSVTYAARQSPAMRIVEYDDNERCDDDGADGDENDDHYDVPGISMPVAVATAARSAAVPNPHRRQQPRRSPGGGTPVWLAAGLEGPR